MVSSGKDRVMTVLDAVVSSYIRLGTPVGSRYISKNFEIGLKPASIRNLLAELEDRGLLAKPHISAGRVPTEKAFRTYLNRLAEAPVLGRRDARIIHKAIEPGLALDELLERVSRLLGKLSNQIGVAVLPGSSDGIVSRLETVSTGPHRLMVTITVEPGMRRTVNLIVDSGMGLEDAWHEVSRIADLITGRKLIEAKRIIQGLRLPRGRHGVRFDGLWGALEYLLRDRGCGVHLSGTANLVAGLTGEAELRMFLEALESKQKVADVVLTTAEERSTVTLGGETAYRSFRGCSVISSKYRIGSARGALGIIGPMRMDYPRLMAVLEFASDELSRLFAGRGGDRGSGAKRERRSRRA
jgi:heat-inducible transcriptional repressor